MAEVVFGLDNLAGFDYEVEHTGEVEQLQKPTSQDDGEAQVPHEQKLIENCLAVDVRFAKPGLHRTEVLVGGTRCVLLHVQQVYPQLYAPLVEVPLPELDLHPDPLVVGHCKHEWKECDDIEDADE